MFLDLELEYPFEEKFLDLKSKRQKAELLEPSYGIFLTQNQQQKAEKPVFPKPQKFGNIFKFKRVKIASSTRDKINSVDLNSKGEIVFSLNKGIIGKMVKRKFNNSQRNLLKTYTKQLIFKGMN